MLWLQELSFMLPSYTRKVYSAKVFVYILSSMQMPSSCMYSLLPKTLLQVHIFATSYLLTSFPQQEIFQGLKKYFKEFWLKSS